MTNQIRFLIKNIFYSLNHHSFFEYMFFLLLFIQLNMLSIKKYFIFEIKKLYESEKKIIL